MKKHAIHHYSYAGTVEGYPGNDDSGAMSSWYIFNALGFFPNAGQDIYYLHGPVYKKAVIQLSKNKRLIMTAENLSEKNTYVQSCTIDGKKLDESWIRHRDIADGAKIHFRPEKSDWGKNNAIPDVTFEKIY